MDNQSPNADPSSLLKRARHAYDQAIAELRQASRPYLLVLARFITDDFTGFRHLARRRLRMELLEDRRLLATISYPDFSDSAGLSLVGHAAIANSNVLRLTPAIGGQLGGAWYTAEKQYVSIDWQTEFQFQLTENNDAPGGSEGIVFVIQNHDPTYLSGGGGAMGYDRLPNSIAIEFDTFRNSNYGDPSDSHISVHTNGTGPNSVDESFSVASYVTPTIMDDTAVHTARIVYSGEVLSVLFDDLSSPVISVPIQMSRLLDLDAGRAWVGFTSATGGGWQNHDILNWEYSPLEDLSTTIAIDDLTLVEGDSGTTEFSFAVNRLGDTTGSTTVDWTTKDDTAVGGSDYTAASGQIVFGDGETVKTISVSVNGDTDIESNEVFLVELSNASNGTLADRIGIGTILTDDISITASDATVVEGDPGFVFLDELVSSASGELVQPRSVVLAGDDFLVSDRALDAVLRFDGDTGEYLGDFIAAGISPLDGPVGMAWGPNGNLFVASQLSDNVLEYDSSGNYVREFLASGASGLNAPTGILFHNGTLLLSSTTGGGGSAGPHEVLRFQGPNQSEPGDPLPAPGQTGAVFVQDGSGGLSNPTGIAIGPDNHLYVSSTYTDSVLRYDGITGLSLGTFIPAQTAGLDAPTIMRFKDGLLYVSGTSTDRVLRFDANTGEYVDTIDPDSAGGIDNPIGLEFAADGRLYVVGAVSRNLVIYGPATTAVVRVSLSSASASDVTVTYTTSDGPNPDGAVQGVDYVAASGVLTIPAGTISRAVLVPTLDDSEVEGNETFVVHLSNASGGIIQDGQGVATIIDDDSLRQITIDDVTVIEGDQTPHYRGAFVDFPANQSFVAQTFGPDGFFYASDGDAINRYDAASGEFVETFIPSGRISGVRDPLFRDGFLYVAAENTDEVLRFDATTGEFVDVFVVAGSGGIDGPRGMTFGPDANNDGISELYVTGGNSANVVRYDGVTGQPLGGYVTGNWFTDPEGLTFDPSGSFLFVTSKDRLLKFDAQTGAIKGGVYARINAPKDLKFGPDGLLYVANAGNDRILRFSSDLSFVDDFVPAGTAGLDDPNRLVFGPDGELYVSGPGTKGIMRFGTQSEAVFTVSLGLGISLPVTVDFSTADGTALAGTDYTPVNGTITIAPGVTQKTILVPILDDSEAEGKETFVLNLSNASGGIIQDGEGEATILDEPPLSALKFFVVDSDVDQTHRFADDFTASAPAWNLVAGNPRGVAAMPDGSAVFVVDANKTVYVFRPDGNLLGSWTATGLSRPEGIATDGQDIWIVDYQTKSVLRFLNAADDPATVGVFDPTITGNLSADSTFTLDPGTFPHPTGITTDGTSLWITDDKPDRDTVFRYSVSGTREGHWELNSANTKPTGITIDPTGASQNIWVIDAATDQVFEYLDARQVDPRDVSGGPLGATHSLLTGNTIPHGIAAILNDDHATTVVIDDASTIEGDNGTTEMVFTVNRLGDRSGTTTVNWTTAADTATAGDDFLAASGQVVFSSGQTQQTVIVTVHGDTVVEGDETFHVDLSGAEGGIIADGIGVGTIISDDASISISDAVVVEGNDGLTVTAKIPGAIGGGPPLDAGDQFGQSVASLGDLDGDGVDDIAIGAWGDDDDTVGFTDSGAVYVMLLNSDGTAKRTTKIANDLNGGPVLSAGDRFGSSVTSIGDWDGNGVADLAVGAWRADDGGSDRGAVYLVLLNIDGTARDTVKIANDFKGGPTLADGDGFGLAVESLGDLNGDGINDLAVGSWADGNGGGTTGAVHILLMGPYDPLDIFDVVGSSIKIGSGTAGAPVLNAGERFGRSIASLGDIDNNPATTLAIAVGSSNDDTGGVDRGAVHVLFVSNTGAVLSSTKIASDLNGGPTLSDQDRFGIAATSLGDLDGDGVTDLAVGALSDDTGGDDRGAVHVLFMNADGSVKATAKIADGSGVPALEDGDGFGSAVAALADLNGDGIRDLAIGARGDDSAAGEGSGAVHLVSLSTDGTAKGRTLEFTVTRSLPISTTSSVDVATADVTAVAGDDYVPIIGGKLQFLPGQTTKTISVRVVGDQVEDGASQETFDLILSNPTHATLGNGLAKGLIQDDDDTTSPTVTLSGPSSPTNSVPFNVTIAFGETVTGFVAGDITVGNGTVTALIDNGGGNFTATINVPADGNVTVDVPAGVASDAVGNNNNAAAQFTLAVDTTNPTPTISGPVSLTRNDPFAVTIDFGEPVIGFVASGITVGNGTVTSLTDDGGGSFTANIDVTTDGTVTIDVPAGGANDVAGNGNLAAAQFSVAVDTTGPTPAISGPASPTNTVPFNVTIAFSETVIGFVAGDITVGNGTVTNLIDQGGGSFTATINATADGKVTVAVPAGVASDIAGNNNNAAAQFTLAVDTTNPTPTISGPVSPTSNDPFAVTIDFGETVIGFVASGITVGNGTVTSLTDNGDGSFTATIDAAMDGTVTIDVPAGGANDVAGNGNLAAAQFSVTVDTTGPTPVISGPATPTNTVLFNVTIAFSETVTGFVAGDITVGNGTVTALIDQGGGNFTATINATADGNVTVAVPAGVASDAAGNANNAAVQFVITVDTTNPAPVISGPASPTNSDPFIVIVDFGEPVTGFVAGDITVGNGTVTALSDDGGGSFTATIDAASDGVVAIDIPASVANDSAGNTSRAAMQFAVVVDTTNPTPVISGPTSPTNSDPFEIVIEFGEIVTGLVAGDISVGNGSVSNLNDNGDGSFTATIDAAMDGTVTIDVPAGGANDAAGNGNLAAARFSVTVDTTGPTPAISGPASPTNTASLNVTIAFSETVTGFVAGDITVGNGTVTALIDNGGGNFTAAINATADGNVTVDVPAGVASDVAGNANNAAVQFAIKVDTTNPTPTISGPVSPTNSDPFIVIVDFGEPVTGFVAGDITVGNGTVTALSDDGGGSFTATIDAASDGVVAIDIPANVANDSAGNTSRAAMQFAVVVDTTNPAPVISGPASPTNSDPFEIVIEFGEIVTGLVAGDISVGNGSVSNLNDNGDGSFTATIEAAMDGTVTIDVPAGGANDAAGNGNLAAARFSVTVDTTGPTPAISGPATPTNTASLNVTIAFGETVTGFVAGDIPVGNGTVTNLIDNGGGSFTATINATADGNVTVDVPAGVASDAAGNANNAAVQIVITVDTTSPTPTISGPVSPTNSDPFIVIVDFGETVTGFVAGDITVGNGTVTALSDDGGGSFTATIDAASDGVVAIDIPANVANDSAGNTSRAAMQFAVVVDTTNPTPVISGPTSPTNSDPFEIVIDFGEIVTGLVAGDISVGNGSVSNLNDNGDGSFTATIDAAMDGTVTIDVPAGGANDVAGNGNLAAAQFSVTVDTTGPTPVISGPATPTNTVPFNVTIAFGETVTGFVAGDITVGNGTVTALIDQGGGNFTATINATADGSVTVDVPAGVASDAVGNNNNNAAAQFTLAVDTTNPTPTISGPVSPTSNDPFAVTIDFGEPVTGFVASGITVGNGTVTSLTDNGDGSFTATIEAAMDGTVTIDVPAGGANDAAGNGNLAAARFSVTVDTTGPTPAISGPASPTNTVPFNVTIAFSETVTGFVAGDITVGNGTVTNLIDNGGGNFTATINATADGSVTVDVPVGVANDAAGNASNAAVQFAIKVDTTSPTPTFGGPTDPSGDPFVVTIAFGEMVTGFAIGDITVSNGSVTDLTDNGGGNFTATINATADGNVTVDVPAGVANDTAGNVSNAAVQFVITVDTTNPTPTISGPVSLTRNDPFAVTIDFGETVTGFVAGDITVGNGTVTALSDDGGGSFTASIDAATDGTVTIDLPAGGANDAAGNSNLAAAQFSVAVDTTGPTPVISGPASPTNTVPFNVTIAFSETVIGFVAGDITVGNGTVTNLIDNGGGNFTAVINATAAGNVTVDVPAGVASDAAGNGNNAAVQFLITVDTTNPTPTISGPVSPTNSDPFIVIVDFGETVTGFVAGDITVGGGSVVNLSHTGDGNYSATIDASADGIVTVDVLANVTSDEAGNHNTAASPFSILIDTTAPVPTISGPASPSDLDPFDISVDFGEFVSGFGLGDLTVTGGAANNLVDQGDGSFTVTIDAALAGKVLVDVPAAVAIDLVGNHNIAATQFSIEIAARLDYGDAPSADQSNLASDYPVLRSQDGARHRVGDLALGTLIDTEMDGQPTVDASGDGVDDDGVRILASMVAASEVTGSSVYVTATGAGSLDAWIDFNRDGDWEDIGEQILTSAPVSAGANVFSFEVPATAAAGDTAARFRLSSAGGLSPRGEAADGEVEDYIVSILDGEDSPSVNVDLIAENPSIMLKDGDFVVGSGQTELFRAPVESVNQLVIHQSASSQPLTIDTRSLVAPPGGLRVEGAGEDNVLMIVGEGGTLDLTDPLLDVRGFGTLDLSSVDATKIVLDAAVVDALSPTTKLVVLVGGSRRGFVIADAPNWRIDEGRFHGSTFILSARTTTGGGETLEAEVDCGWNNFIQPGDVSNNGRVSVYDALLIINELSRRRFSDASTQRLDDPSTVVAWPGIYFDSSCDGRVTALDALRVINAIARQFSSAEAEAELVVASPDKSESDPRAGIPPVRDAVDVSRRSLISTFPALPAKTQDSRRPISDDNQRVTGETAESSGNVDQLLSNQTFLDSLSDTLR